MGYVGSWKFIWFVKNCDIEKTDFVEGENMEIRIKSFSHNNQQ